MLACQLYRDGMRPERKGFNRLFARFQADELELVRRMVADGTMPARVGESEEMLKMTADYVGPRIASDIKTSWSSQWTGEILQGVPVTGFVGRMDIWNLRQLAWDEVTTGDSVRLFVFDGGHHFQDDEPSLKLMMHLIQLALKDWLDAHP